MNNLICILTNETFDTVFEVLEGWKVASSTIQSIHMRYVFLLFPTSILFYLVKLLIV